LDKKDVRLYSVLDKTSSIILAKNAVDDVHHSFHFHALVASSAFWTKPRLSFCPTPSNIPGQNIVHHSARRQDPVHGQNRVYHSARFGQKS
jgi:hypothetical protein